MNEVHDEAVHDEVLSFSFVNRAIWCAQTQWQCFCRLYVKKSADVEQRGNKLPEISEGF